jgi:CubicO group peptidase (beta-lactamase class C family)
VSELIWQPMGAEENASFTVDPSGYALASGGMNATLRDYLRFGAIYLNDGAFNNRQIVPASFVTETRRPSTAHFGLPYTAVTPNGGYRNQFWIEDGATGAIMARGVFGQLIHIDNKADMAVVKLSSLPEFLNPTALADTLAAIHAIERALR